MRYFCALSMLSIIVFTMNTIAAEPAPSTARVIRTTQSGAWSDPRTWEGGKLPASGEKVFVRESHAVLYDVKSDSILRSLHIAGIVYFAHDKETLLNVGLIKIQHGETLDEDGFDCKVHPKSDAKSAPSVRTKALGISVPCLCCEGKPSLLVGTPEQPIGPKHSATIRLHYIEGMDKESCPAIICCGGRMDFHGTPMSHTWVKLGANVVTRDGPVTEITLAEDVTGWKAGDRIIITTSDLKAYKQGGTEERTIQSIQGRKIRFEEPLKYSHLGEGSYRAEVANLSRNVVVESATPEGVRGHTMYHLKSSGSISYAEFRHLGKENVLGKYSIHYHLCGDTMRGSSIIGASIHHSRNRWVTIHGTNYIVVRDTVGYQSIGHGFFLEDGTEVYNVFDRNIACQATEGIPLPKQILPFDNNDGAGFWFSNCHNTFTRNVAVDCGQYGFRFDAAPKSGTMIGKQKFGDPTKPFSLEMDIRQPDGTRKAQDIRTLPFVRFEDNESHSNAKWGLNMGQHSGGKIGPDPATPFVIRNMKIWAVVGGWGVEVPNVLVDGMTIHQAIYGVRESVYVAQDYRNVSINARNTTITNLKEYLASNNSAGSRRHRQPGWPEGTGDGGATFQLAEIEVARLEPVDKLPPISVITHIRQEGSKLIVRGTTCDNGSISKVTLNNQQALLSPNGEWQATLEGVKSGPLKLVAHAEDNKGNIEIIRHEMTVLIRNDK